MTARVLPILFMVLSVFFMQASYAQSVVEIPLIATQLDVQKETYFLVDNTQSVEFQEILQDPNLKAFSLSEGKELNFSYQASKTYWFALTLRTHPEDIHDDWLLELSSPLLDSVTFFYANVHKQSWDSLQTGDMQPFDVRFLPSRYFILPLDFSQQQTQRIYLRVSTQSPMNIPLRVVRTGEMYRQHSNQDAGYGVFAGVLALVCLSNLFVFFTTRIRSYLWYVLLTLAVLVFNLLLSGQIYPHILTSYGGWQNTSFLLFFIVMTALAKIFGLSFLELKERSRLSYHIMRTYLAIELCMLALPFLLPYSAVARIMLVSSFGTFIMLLVVGSIQWRKGFQPARFYVLAYALYFSGTIFKILGVLSVLPHSFLTEHGLELGVLGELITLSFALADKTNTERRQAEKEKEIAQAKALHSQRKALQVQKEANENLEEKVNTRTRELQDTLEELNQINEELVITLEQVENQKALIQHKNENITASINYAQRIQEAILPDVEKLKAKYLDLFVLFIPLDIVSGDFYWYYSTPKGDYFAVVDCTGHGVPGAFMSLLGFQALQQVMERNSAQAPGDVLVMLNVLILNVLHKKGNMRDGMDMALLYCTANEVQYAGAKNPLYYLEQGEEEVKIIKADRHPIGESRFVSDTFQTHQIPLLEGKNTWFYLFSDGFADQFGGAEGRKFMGHRFRKLLVEAHSQDGQAQQCLLEDTFRQWQGHEAQVDDVLVLGLPLRKRD